MPLALSYAGCTVVGNSIGDYDVKNAQKYAKYIIIVGISMEFCLLLSMNVFKHELV